MGCVGPGLGGIGPLTYEQQRALHIKRKQCIAEAIAASHEQESYESYMLRKLSTQNAAQQNCYVPLVDVMPKIYTKKEEPVPQSKTSTLMRTARLALVVSSAWIIGLGVLDRAPEARHAAVAASTAAQSTLHRWNKHLVWGYHPPARVVIDADNVVDYAIQALERDPDGWTQWCMSDWCHGPVGIDIRSDGVRLYGPRGYVPLQPATPQTEHFAFALFTWLRRVPR